jgi:(1->4)-alpha-D-glucan 1-alpha-D-glucosylmutase
VGFKLRENLLAETKKISAEEIWKRHAEGLPKLWLIQKTLKLREGLSGFSNFSYEPIFARGAKAENAVAFSRGEKITTIVPRFLLRLNNEWQDTTIQLPAGNWRNEFTGENFTGEILLENSLKKFPVALLVQKES